MANNEIKLIISADGSKASAALQKLESDTGSLVSKIKNHWLGFTAAIAGTAVLLNKAWSLAEMAAGYEEQMNALNRFAVIYGTTATSIVADIKEITNGQIAMVDIAKISSKALALDVPLDKYKELAKYADAVGDALGASTTQALEMLTGAAEKGAERQMKQIVGVVDLDAKYGKLTERMTEHEKTGKRVDIMLDILKGKYGDLGKGVESTADKMERLTASVKDLQLTLGQLTIRAGLLGQGIMNWGIMQAAAISLVFTKTVEGILWLYTKIPIIGKTGDAAYKTMKEMAAADLATIKKYAKEGSEAFQFAFASSADLAKAMTPTKPDKDDSSKKWLDDMKLATMDWQKRIETLNPELDETDKQLKDLTADAAKLTEKWGKQKWITSGLAKGKAFIDIQQAEKEFDAYAKLKEEQRQIDKKYADETAAEIMKISDERLKALSDSAENTRKISNDIAVEREIINKGELAGKIKQYDNETTEVWRHAQEVIASHKFTAEQILQIYDEASAKQLLLDLKNRDALLTNNGTLTDGLIEGFKKYTQELKTTFQQGVEIARQTAQAMENAFSDFFFDAFQGKMKSLGDYLKSFLTSVQRALAQALSQQVTKEIVAGILNLAAGAATSTSTTSHETSHAGQYHSGGMIMHEGGYVPRFHFGGLSSDERPAILQTGEGVLSRRGMANLGALNNRAGAGGQPNIEVTVNVENKSSQSVNAKKGDVKFDGKQYVVGVILEDFATNGPIFNSVRSAR